MLDSTVQWLLEHTIDSPIKLQLLLLFRENSRMQGSAKQIAERIYRDIWSTSDALQELAESGILCAFNRLGETIYQYHPLPEYMEAIARLYQSYNEPLERDQLQRLVREVASFASYRRAIQGAYEFERI